MIEILACLVLASLATWQGVELVRHSELAGFCLLRQWSEQAEASTGLQRLLLTPLRSVSCGWCVSIWVGLLMCTLSLVAMAIGPPIGFIWLLIPMALASSRLANLFNDITHAWCRTPRREHDGHELDRVQTEDLEAELVRRRGD